MRKAFSLRVDHEMTQDAQDIFQKMDSDMDRAGK